MAVANEREVHWALDEFLTTIGYEIIETADGPLPVLEPISEIAGQMAVAVAAHLLRSTPGGRGILLGYWRGRGRDVGCADRAGFVPTTWVLDNNLGKLRRLHGAANGRDHQPAER